MNNANGATGLSIDDKSIGVEVRKGGKKNATGDVGEGKSCPPPAVQPIKGGIAPTTAPTQVLSMLFRFNQVYNPAYSAILVAPKIAVVGLTIVHSIAGPLKPVTSAKPAACADEIALRTRGRMRVRVICASNGIS